MQAALDAIKLELMLFGVASLLLKVLETPITSICSELLSTLSLFCCLAVVYHSN